MKKAKADNSALDAHRQNFVGKVLSLPRYQVVVDDVIAEGMHYHTCIIVSKYCCGDELCRSLHTNVTQ